MDYVVTKMIPAPAEKIWRELSDLTHFARRDPYHHDLVWVGEGRQGVGAAFRLRHFYAPVFPFQPDEVRCEVTHWEPERRLTIFEKNSRAYRSHTQEFTLEPQADGTRLTYRISYRGIPWPLLPWRWWVQHWVLSRMREKVNEIAST